MDGQNRRDGAGDTQSGGASGSTWDGTVSLESGVKARSRVRSAAVQFGRRKSSPHVVLLLLSLTVNRRMQQWHRRMSTKGEVAVLVRRLVTAVVIVGTLTLGATPAAGESRSRDARSTTVARSVTSPGGRVSRCDLVDRVAFKIVRAEAHLTSVESWVPTRVSTAKAYQSWADARGQNREASAAAHQSWADATASASVRNAQTLSQASPTKTKGAIKSQPPLGRVTAQLARAKAHAQSLEQAAATRVTRAEAGALILERTASAHVSRAEAGALILERTASAHVARAESGAQDQVRWARARVVRAEALETACAAPKPTLPSN
jgi:hypothetical protein